MMRTRSKPGASTSRRNGSTHDVLFTYRAPDSATESSDINYIEYTKHDHKQLQPPRFLNDTIISFFMQYFLDSKVDQAVKERIHVFNSFFFVKIQSIRQARNGLIPSHGFTSGWRKDMRLFDKDFLIMPVCEREHWLLVIVCYPDRLPSNKSQKVCDEQLFEPAVIVLNSCNGLAPSIKKSLSQFLRYQWRQERGTDRSFNINNAKKTGIRLLFPDLPQQKNNYDCGVYILGYFYSFLTDPRATYVKMFRRHSMKTWFKDNNIDISRERRKMISTIRKEIATYTETRKTANGCTDGQSALTTLHEIHIGSPSSFNSSNDYQEIVMDVNGNDQSVIVLN